ncbi:MAG: RNA-binding transcriptional accessory protein [Erysipelotrichaceae bacterium]|nr:RNA-binding transcriptional accessory protein [Erysipelotrichaceae bacterium]
MEQQLIKEISQALNVSVRQIEETLKLLEEGNTVPFIARYRKERTGSLDEEQIRAISKQYEYQVNLENRKQDVLRLIEAQGKLTGEIRQAVLACTRLKEVEDIYRPYQQKRKTRASEAVRKGLQPLADWLLSLPVSGSVEQKAAGFVNEEVKSAEEALQGARDIIAEKVSDDPKFRKKIYDSLLNYGFVQTKVKKDNPDEKKVYQLYYDHKEKLKYIEAHRVMAINRAQKEKVITVSFEYDTDYLNSFCLKGLTKDRYTVADEQISLAVSDGLKRLAFPSVENEVWGELSEKAEEKSIEVFSGNLEKLLLQPPLTGRTVLGFDPAYRTGCKLAVLDKTGKVLKIDKIFPHQPVNKKAEAEKTLLKLISDYKIEIIAIGNGTASRESEAFVSELIRKNRLDVQFTLVSEAGASVYSASELARAEFPDLHVEERSAVSIGRRIQDPLAELIKIDPKSIGVGQYQHDLPQKQLEERLDFAVEKVVNRVGVDANTASRELLAHVSGFNKAAAENFVAYRNQHGSFTDRQQFMEVKRFTDRLFQQASGFLRVPNGSEPLDATEIHPESYGAAKAVLALAGNLPLGSEQLAKALDKLDREKLAGQIKVDKYTLNDIIASLKTPLRDYRDQYDGPVLRSDILELSDLRIGERLQGVVRNVVDFGAFVDVGLHDDGLIHKSRMGQGRNPVPSEILSVGDIVEVEVCGIDLERGKVQLGLIRE